MSTALDSRPDGRPAIRLFDPSDNEGSGPPGITPAMTLSEFFEVWFLPILLVGTGKDEDTIKLYRDSIRWWCEITSDPPLLQIDDYTIAEFAAGLRQATYRRGKLGAAKPLSKLTISRHLKHVKRILQQAAAGTPGRPGKKLIEEAPLVAIPTVRSHAKACFTWEQLVAVFDAAGHWPRPCSHVNTADRWWAALLTLLLYTGLRIGDVLRIQWSQIEERDGEHWLSLAAEDVDKTEKPKQLVLHATCWAAISTLRRDCDQVLVPRVRYDTADKWHRALQLRAGVKKVMGWNAWRRTHAAMLGAVGYNDALQRAQQALDHGDVRTTRDFYYNPINDCIRRMPAVPLPTCARQLTLF